MNIKFLIGISILLIATWSFRSPAPKAESGIEGQVCDGNELALSNHPDGEYTGRGPDHAIPDRRSRPLSNPACTG